MESHPLADRAMLARLNVTRWTPTKIDKEVSKEIARQKGADPEKAGAYHKSLIAKTALSDLTRIYGSSRTLHYKLTSPWNDNGQRILSAKMYLKYVAEMTSIRTEFLRLAADLCDNFDGYVAEARLSLGAMFNSGDYPTSDELTAKYSFEFGIDPIPDVPDFRVNLPEAEVERLKAEIFRRAEAAMVAANADLWKRVHDVVSHMAETLKEEKPRIFDSLVTNIAELAELLDDMNVAQDKDLSSMAAELKAGVGSLDPDALRQDEGARKVAAQTATAVSEKAFRKMSGYGRRRP